MSKLDELMAIIQEEIEARCSDLMGKEIHAPQLHRLEQAARLSAKKLNLKPSYTYEEMAEILGSEEQLLSYKDFKNIWFRFLVPMVSLNDSGALTIQMNVDPIVTSMTVFPSPNKLAVDVQVNSSSGNSTTSEDRSPPNNDELDNTPTNAT